MTDIKEFNCRCTYHTVDHRVYKLFAASEHQARQIAEKLFMQDHTDICILDGVDVAPPGPDAGKFPKRP